MHWHVSEVRASFGELLCTQSLASAEINVNLFCAKICEGQKIQPPRFINVARFSMTSSALHSFCNLAPRLAQLRTHVWSMGSVVEERSAVSQQHPGVEQ